MKTEMGEYIIGAYLKIIEGCDYVDYNVHYPEVGREGQGELDVIVFKLKEGHEEIFLCEVSTHLDGMVYGQNYSTTVKKVIAKYKRQQTYRERYLPKHFSAHYFLCSPIILPKLKSMICEAQNNELQGLELLANDRYQNMVEQLKNKAKTTTKDFGNPFFRVLQILGHVRNKD
jgi:hypothetical protein